MKKTSSPTSKNSGIASNALNRVASYFWGDSLKSMQEQLERMKAERKQNALAKLQSDSARTRTQGVKESASMLGVKIDDATANLIGFLGIKRTLELFKSSDGLGEEINRTVAFEYIKLINTLEEPKNSDSPKSRQLASV